MTNWPTFTVVLILFISTLIRSAFGFGEALIAVPLLALLMPVEIAAPLAVLASITIALLILIQDWRLVDLREAGWLVISTLLGIPFGLLLLKTVAEPAVKTILAAIIIAFSAYSLASRHTRQLTDDRFAWIFGFHAGVLGGAYGMNGPPLAIYGTLRRWPPERFRATLQGYFLPASLAGMAGYFFAGLWTPVVNHFYLISLPAVVIATLAGRTLNRRLSAPRFALHVYIGLITIGMVLLCQAVLGWSRVFN